ncbi:MAG TPA: HAMP domain-containing sensor histidine kinase [Bacteroidales bacterium]|nr:HAMP domain-containing sensor histidine kinase [Bacteroidales bacterium]
MARAHDSSFTLRMAFFIGAAIITVASTLFSNRLAKNLAMEERKKMELWAEAIRLIASEPTQGIEMDYTLSLKVIEGNTNIPVILVDDKGDVLSHNNLGLKNENDTAELGAVTRAMIKHNQFIEVKINDKVSHFVYYQDSKLLRKLTYFPFVQLIVMFIFLLITLFALNSTNRAEQDRVWVGLSKETAHQLGTPISSLMAWVELLKLKNVDANLLDEMNKDTQRLQTIAQRFSKIGSKPETTPQDIKPALENAVQYMRNRSSRKITINTHAPTQALPVYLNVPLFEWVIENLCKNAIDAMDATGKIDITLTPEHKHLFIDVTDTGKGITKSNFKTVFKPGFTTKARGWGLGLSLVKRIIEENHNGKIFVKNSEIGKGTTFRIILKMA